MTFSLFSFAMSSLFLRLCCHLGLGGVGPKFLLLYLSFFSTLSQPQMQSLNLLLFLPVAGLSLYFHRKNKLIDTAVLSRCILSGAVGGGVRSKPDFQSHRPTAAAALLGIFLLCIGLREGYLAAKLICKNFFHLAKHKRQLPVQNTVRGNILPTKGLVITMSNGFQKFISGKGFYLALAVCLAGQAAVPWVAVDKTIQSVEPAPMAEKPQLKQEQPV